VNVEIMPDDQNFERQDIMLEIIKVLRKHLDELPCGATLEETAREWLNAGFTDADEVEDWLRARCFDAARAQALEMAGLTPEQASLRTRAGTASYEDTIACKFAQGDLSLDEARRIITSHFWNS
jgi:hypothetical protein